jgi:hypothetical protein
MADKKQDQPKTEKTPKTGITVPIPKRGEFFANLKKVAGKEPRSHESGGAQS